MRAARRLFSISPLPLVALALVGMNQCGGQEELQWYFTCGDPVCGGYTPHEGVPLCTTEKEGDPCSVDGQTCDPKDDCNRLMVCAAEDPTQDGCPISRAAFKKDITYLDGPQLKQYHEELMGMRLATWQYKDEQVGTQKHLGFIIDDQPGSPAVRPGGQRVDLYGYTSLTVAALQVQQKELEALRAEVARLQKELEADRTHRGTCGK